MSTSKYNSNELLGFLDSDRITNEQKIAILNHMIDQELEKSESEADMELIQECTAFIEELHDQKYQITDAKLESRLNAIKAGKSFSENATESVGLRKSSKVLPRRRWIALVAAVITMVILASAMAMTAYARANGYSNAWEWVASRVKELSDMKPGKKEIDGITIIKGDENRTYATVEEFLQAEGLDILYPTVLPDGVKVEKIVQTFYGEGKFDLTFVFNTSSIQYSVYNFDLYRFQITDAYEVIECNNYAFSVLISSSGAYQANNISESYAYCISCENYDELKNIVNELEETERGN